MARRETKLVPWFELDRQGLFDEFSKRADGQFEIKGVASGDNPALWFTDESGNDGFVLYYLESSKDMVLSGREAGSGIQINGRNAANTNYHTIFSADPDGAASVFYNNGIAGRGANGGWEVHAVGNDNPAVTFYQNDNSTRNGFLQFQASGNGILRSEVHGQPIYIQGEDAGGTIRDCAIFDPDGPIATFNSVAGGVVVGAPTGGDKGSGTINAKAVYDDNVLLTDYVFDAALDGRVSISKWDALVPDRVKRVKDSDDNGPAVDIPEPRVHEPARKFAQRLDDLDPKAYADKWKAARKLPAFILGPNEDPQLPVGSYAQRLLETCEVQAVHIEELRQRIEALESGV